MRRFLNSHPVTTSLGIVVIYFAILTAPSLWSSNAFGGDPSRTPQEAPLDQLGLEIFLAVSIVAVVFLLGWGRSARLTTGPAWGGLWYMLPPALITLLLLGLGAFAARQNGLDPGAILGSGMIQKLLPLVILVGIFEEVLFRGVLLHGLEAQTGPVAALLASSVIFGAMHYVNWIDGQGFAATTQQVIHATFAGFLYGAITLRTGSVWPSAALHAFWDLTVTLNGAMAVDKVDSLPGSSEDSSIGSEILSFALQNFEALFGLVVLVGWYRWHRSNEQ